MPFSAFLVEIPVSPGGYMKSLFTKMRTWNFRPKSAVYHRRRVRVRVSGSWPFCRVAVHMLAQVRRNN